MHPRASRADPLEWVLLAYLLLGGISTLTGAGRPASLSRVLTSPYLEAWSWSLAVGAAAALAGCGWQRVERARLTTGLALEQVGLILIAGDALIYLLALLAVRAQGGLLAASFLAMIGSYAAWRVWSIARARKAMIAATRLECP